MKTLPTIAAAAIALTLLLVPIATSAAGSITFTSPASGASYKGTVSYTISGTISPAPTQADNVGITVKNPSGQTVDVANVAVSSAAFSYATATGSSVNPSSWPTGTYTITAIDSFGASGTATFSYTGSTSNQYNVTRALINIQGNLTIINKEIKNLNNDLNGNVTAIKATQTTQGNAITSLTNTVSGIQQSLASLTSTVSGLVTTVGNINTAVSGMSSQITTAANNALSAANAVSSTQTYVLVVAVLAAITLVLELAILVRKLS